MPPSPPWPAKTKGLCSANLAWAVNTVYKKDNILIWKNTDIDWIINPISKNIDLNLINTAYILWAWWASKAVISAMIKSWIKNIYVLNRSKDSLDLIYSHFNKYLADKQKLITCKYDISKWDNFLDIFNKNNINSDKSSSNYFIIINTLPFWFNEDLPKYPISESNLEILCKK